MKIAIGTTNKLKVDAITSALRPIFRDAEFVSASVESGVSDDPKGDEEGIRGALNRARNAMDKEHADMGVGPEGITSKNSYGTFVYGYVVIVDKEDRIGIGASAKVMLPDKLAKMIDSGDGLADAIAELSAKTKEQVRTELGTNGILTNGMYDRNKEFADAALCAAARFINKLYE
ncbi:MAG: DUF84 family protein [Candidatus Micrarchaeia archaeon]